MLRKGVHPVAPEVPSRASGMVHSYVNLVEREEAGEEVEEDNDNDEEEEEEADEVLDLYSRPKKFYVTEILVLHCTFRMFCCTA